MGIPIIILHNLEDEITVNGYSGKDTDTLKFSFDLTDKNQRLLGVLFASSKSSLDTDFEYLDFYPEDYQGDEDPIDIFGIQIDAGGPYNVETGESLQLSGLVESGEINNNYEWFWTFDDSSITLEGQNPTYKFRIPDIYTGKIYIYDGKGSWSVNNFEVNVTGTNIDVDNNNNEPGFELILVIAALAVALLLFRKKKNN
jgi:hypothetical protein